MMLSLIAAVARNGAIGDNNKLLWRLSTDMRRFRALSWGKPVIMGRKTYESIGKPLRGRETIIVTRDPGYTIEGAHVVGDVEAALALAAGLAGPDGEIISAGGGEIYAQTIGRADRLFITEVDLAPEGNVRFPSIDPAVWREAKREKPGRGERDEAEFEFVEYVRRYAPHSPTDCFQHC
jgi:dihydrofolate reductase